MEERPEHSARYSPPRYWWLRRLLGLGVLTIACLATLRGMWGVHADRQLDREIIALRERGQPAAAADLTPDELPDDQNAASHYNRAVAAMNRAVDSPTSSSLSFREYPPYPPEWWNLAKSSYDAHSVSLQIVRGARQHPHAVWRKSYASPLIGLTFPSLTQQRQLADMVTDAAVYLHMRGDDRQSLEVLLDAMHHVEAIEQERLLMAHMTAISIRALIVTRVAMIAPGLGTPPAERELKDPHQPADRGQVLAVIERLLDEKPQRDGCIAAIAYERVLFLDTVRETSGRALVLSPAFRLDAAGAGIIYDSAITAARTSCWENASRHVGGPPPALPADRLSQLMRTALIPALNRFVQTEFRVRLLRRFAAVSLAANLYRMETGKWPAALEQLVPSYLSAVPIDPYDADGGTLRYKIVDGVRPVVYSVGENGAPEFSDEMYLPTPVYDWSTSTDPYMDLSRFTPPPPTTAPSDASMNPVAR